MQVLKSDYLEFELKVATVRKLKMKKGCKKKTYEMPEAGKEEDLGNLLTWRQGLYHYVQIPQHTYQSSHHPFHCQNYCYAPAYYLAFGHDPRLADQAF